MCCLHHGVPPQLSELPSNPDHLSPYIVQVTTVCIYIYIYIYIYINYEGHLLPNINTEPFEG